MSMSQEVERYNPTPEAGLSEEQVKSRREQGLVNKTIPAVGKTYWQIIKDNVFSFFNILLFVIAGFMIYANVMDQDPRSKWYRGIFFVFVLLANIFIGLFQDFRAKSLMKKMHLITAPKALVVRNWEEQVINPSEIVLDDILVFNASDQIVSDGVVVKGTALVNESLLTGESLNIAKKPGDIIYSGTYVVSGQIRARVEKVGKENYVETIASKAREFKRSPSHILKSLTRLFHILGYIVISMFVILQIINVSTGSYSTNQDFINTIHPAASQLVAIIPSGLFLLTSLALATSVISLLRKNANVQDLYSVEMLARIDVLCVDKTGTITDGTMKVNRIIPLDGRSSEEDIKQIIGHILEGTKDNNLTAKALAEVCVATTSRKIIATLPFNSDTKYSGVSLDGRETYLIGAPEYLNVQDKINLINKGKEYTSKGLRVLIVAKGNKVIEGTQYSDTVKAVGFVVIKDHVREDALATFKWFKENNVEIKVISGDNALTVSEIAKEAGIENADKYISLEGKSIEEVKELATQYNVFGRVTPEQKEAIVIALKQHGKTVAMTGDGVNDILALKRADCSIAMNNGAQAAKNVSHVILMTNDFSTMPSIVAEGRRVINNIQRTGSLFLAKTFFAVFISILFFFVSLFTANRFSYPFNTNNMLIWENLGIGFGAFFIALQPNSSSIKKGFLRNILKKAFPGAALIVLGVLSCYLLFVLQDLGIMYTGVSSLGYSTATSIGLRGGATGMAVITMTLLSFYYLLRVCSPLDKYRLIVTIMMSVIGVGLLVLTFFLGGRNIFAIDVDSITYENLIAIAVILLILVSIFIFIPKINSLLKKEKPHDDKN